MNRKIWVLGDAVIDLLPEAENRLLQCPGGAPANVAVGVARLGGESAFIGCVGDDPFGAFMRRTLQQEGVDTRFMFSLTGQRTSTVLVGLDADGERQFTFMVRPSADLFLTADCLPDFAAGDGLHLCSIALSTEPSRSAAFEAMAAIRQAGGWVSFDPNLRDDLWPDAGELERCLGQAFSAANIIKLSEEELNRLTTPAGTTARIQQFATRYRPALLLVTLGGDGVYVWHRDQLQHFSAPRVKVVDTTGAGDAFVAGLLTALAREEDPLTPARLAEAVDLAQRSGAAATTAKGAMTALPRVQDLPAAR